MVVSGNEGGSEVDNAEAAMNLALDMLGVITQVRYPQDMDKHLQVRWRSGVARGCTTLVLWVLEI